VRNLDDDDYDDDDDLRDRGLVVQFGLNIRIQKSLMGTLGSFFLPLDIS
jgi:hypothetical protein